ncbi:MAG: PQQ-binding-like beta-propeller repeat protein [Nitrososphaerales archaeon]
MKLLLASFLIFFIYTNAYASENTIWPMYKQDPQHTGQSPFNGSEENILRWKFPTGERIQGSPTIGIDGTIYITSHDSTLYAISRDGREKWSFQAMARIDSTPAIASDGTVYFGAWDGALYSIAPSGRGKWKVLTSDQISSSPTIGPDNTIYIGSDDGFVYAIFPNGTLRWSFRTNDRVFSTPGLSPDGTIYVGSFDNNLYAINPDGTEKWRFKTGGFVFSSPAIASDGTVYFGAYDNNVYGVHPNGTLKWRFATQGVVQGSPSVASDGTIYVGSFDNNLYAINPDGTEKWRFKTNDLVVSSPAIDADGTVYVGSVDMFVYAINPDGTEKWRFKTNDRIFSSPAIDADGTVYVGSVDGNLYAIGKPLESSVFGLPRNGIVNELIGYAGTELYVSSTNVLPGRQTSEISVEVLLRNVDSRPRAFDLESFRLKDLNGFEYTPDAEKSMLHSVKIQSGDVMRGVLFFKSDTDISPVELLYHDVRGVRLTVDLTNARVPPDEEPLVLLVPGSNLGKKIIDKNLEMTIVDEKFLESDPQQYVITLSLRNRGNDEIVYDQVFAYVKDSNGNVFLPDTSRSVRGTLVPGQMTEVKIWFMIPANVDSVVFVYDDGSHTIVIPEFPLGIFVVASAISFLVLLSKFTVPK